MEFRDWLKLIREDGAMRMATRRNGKHNFVGEGRLIPGPFTIEARREILDRLLCVQEEVGMQLISEEEIQVVRRIWAEDMAALTLIESV